MAVTHVVSALRRKYAELKGQLHHYPADDPEATMLAISQVGAVLRMFSPGLDLTAIRPKRPHTPRQGRWTRIAVCILRDERRPMTARELARQMIFEARLDPKLVSTIECSLHVSLAALEGDGVARVCETPKRWAVASI